MKIFEVLRSKKLQQTFWYALAMYLVAYLVVIFYICILCLATKDFKLIEVLKTDTILGSIAASTFCISVTATLGLYNYERKKPFTNLFTFLICLASLLVSVILFQSGLGLFDVQEPTLLFVITFVAFVSELFLSIYIIFDTDEYQKQQKYNKEAEKITAEEVIVENIGGRKIKI